MVRISASYAKCLGFETWLDARYSDRDILDLGGYVRVDAIKAYRGVEVSLHPLLTL
jgi:hypothetical protein